MNKMQITKKLRELRGDRSLETVARACGVTRQAVCHYETGRRTPKDDIKVKLAEYYGASVQSIFYSD